MNRHALSKVKTFNLIDNGNSSYIQFGDRRNFNAKYRGFAIKQTIYKTTANAGEPMFDQYAVFSKQYKQDQLIKFPRLKINVNKPKYLCEFPDTEAEKLIDHINITISSTSSSVLIGNGKRHYAESRVKHIRQHL